MVGGMADVIPREGEKSLPRAAEELLQEVAAWSAAGLRLDESIMRLHVPADTLTRRLRLARAEVLG